MLIYKGGQKIEKGTYWDLRKGHRVNAAQKGVLPGGDTSIYLRIPSAAMLLFGLISGVLYVVFLPFIGIALIAAAALRRVVEVLVSLAGSSFSFDWRPKSAYLTWKRKEKPKEKSDKK